MEGYIPEYIVLEDDIPRVDDVPGEYAVVEKCFYELKSEIQVPKYVGMSDGSVELNS